MLKQNILSEKGFIVELMEGDGVTYAVTQHPYVFSLDGQLYTIPAGFVSDGCSLPRFFWRLIGHPFDMQYLREAIVHDYLYRNQPCARKKADKIFYRMLEDNELGYRRILIYVGLRLFGWIAWIQNKRRLERHEN